MKEVYELTLDKTTGAIQLINTATGEVQEVTIKKKTSRKKKVEDNDPTPKVTLLEGKYQFNNAAVELMGIEPDDRIDIKYERKNKQETPVIGTDEVFKTKGGNRLTKTYTVSCKGEKRERLSKYGDVFEVKPHPSTEGLFILVGNTPEPVVEDEPEVELPDDDMEVDLALDDLVEDVDEITNFDFNLD